ncbi:PREDICTED: genetic suppressor element 1 [Condylura cristata]|uniref:genetic suppressor element 1 n=1 Tax=Condylura cristata TaxID=143302 RepID=UPI000642FE51|nr:PREDICTED: genetic suppressor element 1 [Condylura cristata]
MFGLKPPLYYLPGSSLSSESSPVSSPATNHSSPASTPKRVPMGPIIVPPGGHSVPSTPPVVTIAPTKTVNGVWRSESRQDASSRGSSGGRERLIVEPPLPQEKGGPAIASHLLSSPYPFGISPSSVVQDSRFPPLNLQRPVHHVVTPSTVTEDYLRSFRPYHTTEDLRMSSLPPLGLDPAAAAYYHPSYLAPHPFPHPAFRAEKLKDSSLPAPKPVQHPLHPAPTPHHAVPSLLSGHTVFPLPGSSAAAALLIQRTNEEEKWLARQRRLRQEKEDRQSQVSEFRQQVLEQHLDMGRPPAPEAEHRPESARPAPNRHEPGGRDPPQHFGGPPPLISPKPQHHSMPTALWNPVSLMDSTLEPRRAPESHPLHSHPAPFEPSRPAAVPLVKVERVYCSEKSDEGSRKREATPLDKYQPPPREAGSLEHQGFPHGPGPFLAELEKSTQTLLGQPRASLTQPPAFGELSGPLKPGSPYRPPAPRGPDPAYIFDELLQQRRRLVSKLDLEERRRREAREKGYYYDLDDSYDESDEEEVRAHLRCVAEQPPLKLDTSSEKLEFLQLFGLTTQQQKEELLTQKRRKRRRMLRERSPSPPTVQSKRQTPSPRLALSTRYSPDEMNDSPNFEEKKKFLTIFNLTHISAEKRRDKERLVEMLHAMKQKALSAAVADSLRTSARDSPAGSLSEPAAPASLDPEKPVGVAASLSDAPKATEPGRLEHLRPPDLAGGEKARLSEAPGGKQGASTPRGVQGPAPKDSAVPLSHSVNGRSKPWEPFMAEEFAHQFHESVLQSTQKALQKHKGNTAVLSAEQNHKVDASVHYNIPELQSSSRLPLPQHNGQPEPPAVRKGPLTQEMDQDSEEDDDDGEEEEEVPRRRWQGIEAIFEAYQEHIEEQDLERQVLQTQCRRLEAQHYSLSLTAEQLSHSMAELRSQKQKIVSERERLQAELDHLRKCLALPAMHWPRGYFKGYPR